MKRTQIQIPDPLYRQIKRVAALQDWSVSEVFRRAAELIVAQFPPAKLRDGWTLPEARDMGIPLIPPERWHELLTEDEAGTA